MEFGCCLATGVLQAFAQQKTANGDKVFGKAIVKFSKHVTSEFTYSRTAMKKDHIYSMERNRDINFLHLYFECCRLLNHLK